MDKVFNLAIITREKTLYEGKASSLVAPCEFGFLGVLADHAPLVANVVSGKIVLKKDTGEPLTFYSKGKGFLEVMENSVTLVLTS